MSSRHRRHVDLDDTSFGETSFGGEEVDPMASVANLVDAMLVFACGLMMALVVYWNIDLSGVQDVSVEQDMTEVTDIEQMTEDMQSGGSGYNELGMVYQDPATGQMYMITDSTVTTSTSTDTTGSE